MTSRSPIQSIPSRDAEQRQLEVIVLTQVRDSMALISSGLAKVSDKVDGINENVISILAARYSEQIAKLERDVYNRTEDIEKRVRDHERQLTRLSMGMAISGAVGGSALGAVIVLALTRIFGGV